MGLHMKEYDLIVIGSGAGMNVASKAREKGMKVAVVENGPMGGTCLNRGCIPSKIMVTPADIVRVIADAKRIGIHAKVERTDFQLVRKRMWDLILPDRDGMLEAVKADKELDFYPTTAHFTDKYTLQAGSEQITAQKIIIAAGARTKVPEIPGLLDVGFLTSEDFFDMTELPESMVILGGGYKASELGMFLASFGCRTTIIGHNPRLLKNEEPEISEIVLKRSLEYMDVRVNQEVTSVRSEGGEKVVVHKDRSSGEAQEVRAKQVLVTTGVQSNADWLRPQVAGIIVDKNNYVVVDKFMETNVPGIYAIGDIIGRTMFRHTANYHSELVWYNMFGAKKVELDEHAVPHAVFGYPEVGSVGLTQEECKRLGLKVLVGRKGYMDCAKGYAMGEEDGFVKVIVDQSSRRILGAHIVGSHAAILVQQVVYLMNAGDQTYMPMARSQCIHPALSEAVTGAFANLVDPEHHHH
ncbi:MAG TPA: dihydrolipoyl dehydrogenase [Methanomassiliicoccales archaeon]|nr:dihydrolipoyl dehydrogenase [Methanomassiliicoccales archaeon]